MKGRVFFIIIALALIFSYSADGAEINSNIFLPDGMGNLYKVESTGFCKEVGQNHGSFQSLSERHGKIFFKRR